MSGNQQSLILLDSNILIHILRNDESVWERIEQIGWRNCCISEISVVELLYGVECSYVSRQKSYDSERSVKTT